MLSSMAAICVLLFASPAAFLEVPATYPTIQAAIDAAQAGDTVYVRAGAYEEALSFKRPITLEGEGKALVVVRRPATDGPVLSIAGCDDSVVRGMAFEHTGAHAEDDENADPPAVVEIGESSVELFGVEARNGIGSGIRIVGHHTSKVLKCTAVDNLRIGMVSKGKGSIVHFVGNTCTGNGSGIAFDDGASGTAKINSCVENRLFGITIESDGNPVLFGNTCSRNGRSGIVCNEGSHMYALGNRCMDNKGSGIALLRNSSTLVQFNRLENNRRNAIWSASFITVRQKGNAYHENGEFWETEALPLFEESRFAEIEEYAARFRRDNAMTYYGEWKLPNLYNGITSKCDNMSKTDERTFLLRVQEWKKAFPNSVACAIVEAKAYCEFAWRERGSGWASSVSKEGWKGFFAYLDKALATIEAAEKLPEKDPHLFVAKCTVMLGQSKTDSELPPILSVLSWWTDTDIDLPSPAEQAFLQGVAIDPTYYPLHYSRVTPLLPRWGGSTTEMVRFAEWAAAKTAATEGESLYARVAFAALDYDGRDNYLDNYRFSWPRIRQGYRDILERFPDSETRLNTFCLMACLHNDRETAKELFERIGDKWHGDAWENEAQFQHWKTWAMKGGQNPAANPLEKALRDGNVTEVERRLKAGGDPNTVGEAGKSLLAMAIRARNMDMVKTLLANGANVNFVPPDKIAPISTASWDHDSDAYLRLLIEHGANPNVTPPDGWSPLLYSIGQSLRPRVPYLLEHGANPNDVVNGQPALFHAIYRNDMDSVRALVDKGADVNRRDSQDRTPLQWAERSKKLEIAAYLREHGAK